jgi:RimJ/RimL family protein N-acetyltransferase
MIHLRPANMQDADRLFAWRNDPVTCANSRSTAAISREDHDRWMQFNVLQGYPEHFVMIAEGDAGSVGVVRFDAAKNDLMTYVASITIAPQHRGAGLACPILDMACGYFPDFAIDAEIRCDNKTSQKVFERCGFQQTSLNLDFIKYRREPLA